MLRDEMLRLLGLTFDYTEEELKKAYRKMAKENHPDLYHGDKEKEEKFKKISEAYQELSKKFKNSTDKTNYTSSAHTTYNTYNAQSYYNNRRSLYFIRLGYLQKLSDYFENAPEEFESIIVNTKERMDVVFEILYKCTSEKEMKESFDGFLSKYKSSLRTYAINYFSQNFVNTSDIKEDINYDLPLREFKEELERIKNKYGKEDEYILKIKDIYNRYIENEKNSVIIRMLKRKLARSLNTLKLLKYKDFDNTIIEIISDIEIMIKRYKTLLERAETLRNEFKTMYGSDIIDMISQSKYDESIIDNLIQVRNISHEEIKGINFLISFSENLKIGNEHSVEEALKEYEKLVLEKKNIMNNKEEINSIHKVVLENFNIALSEVSEDIVSRQKAIINCYNKYLTLYKLALEGKVSIEKFRTLSSITFKDLDKDNQILTNTVYEDETKENIKGNIYVGRGRNSNYPYTGFCYLVETGNELTLLELTALGGIISMQITPQELKENYIPFEEFIENFEFDGKCSSYWLKPYIVLYRSKDSKTGIILEDSGNITIDNMYEYKNRYFKDEDIKRTLPLEDKKNLEKAILKMFRYKVDRLSNYDLIRNFSDSYYKDEDDKRESLKM